MEMPSRWWVPIPGLTAERVRLDHVHAAVSGWFDHSSVEHRANDKPYAVSPPSRDAAGGTGIEVAVLTDLALEQLRQATTDGSQIRLGNQVRRVHSPIELASESWSDLASDDLADRWTLELATPATFRSGDRSSPLPSVRTILTGLARTWSQWAPPSTPTPVVPDGSVWVSDLDLRSDRVSVAVRDRSTGQRRDLVVSGVMGRVTLRCDDESARSSASSLLRLASYSGVGSMTRKGLGVVRVGPTHRRERAHGAAG